MKTITLLKKMPVVLPICMLVMACSNELIIEDISIAKWKDDKKAAFAITSADGLIRSIKSQWTPENPDVPYDGYYKLGKDHSIPITFFLIPRLQDDAAINDTSHVYFSSRMPPALEPGFGGTWEDWQFMSRQGHEMASHTYSHEDFRLGPDGKPVSPVDPHIDMTMAIESIEKNIGVKPILVNFGLGRPAPKVLAVTRSYYPLHAGDVFGSEHVVNQVCKKITRFEQLNNQLEIALKNGKWLIFRSHGIGSELGRLEEAAPDFLENGKRYDGFSPVKYEVLDSIFRVINNKRDSIYIDVFSNVYRYLSEREESKIKVVKESQKEKIIQVNNQLDNEIYSIPLTLKITLSEGATEPKVFQNGEKLNVIMKGNALLFDVIPNTGDISIKI
jgi:peptidoglycan/xylan/chitin deacetylase (PgdA/CDA1 family)